MAEKGLYAAEKYGIMKTAGWRLCRTMPALWTNDKKTKGKKHGNRKH